MMNTEKLSRAEAARINGGKSRGPVTTEGKARSSLNAHKHGCYSKAVVLPGESQEDFLALVQSYTGQFQPATQFEIDLIQDLADARWRINRIKLVETLEWGQAAYEAAQ